MIPFRWGEKTNHLFYLFISLIDLELSLIFLFYVYLYILYTHIFLYGSMIFVISLTRDFFLTLPGNKKRGYQRKITSEQWQWLAICHGNYLFFVY